MLARHLVLPGDDLLEALGLHEADSGGELAQPEVQAGDRVVGLAVVAEQSRELDQARVARAQRAALACGDRLRRVEGVDAGVPVGAWLAPVPVRAVRMCAV